MAMDMDMHEYDSTEASATGPTSPPTGIRSPVVVEELQAKEVAPLPQRELQAKEV